MVTVRSQAVPKEEEVITTSQAVRYVRMYGVPRDTPLVLLAEAMGKQVVSGAEIMTLQAVDQFALYTGQRPSQKQVRAAALHARKYKLSLFVGRFYLCGVHTYDPSVCLEFPSP